MILAMFSPWVGVRTEGVAQDPIGFVSDLFIVWNCDDIGTRMWLWYETDQQSAVLIGNGLPDRQAAADSARPRGQVPLGA